MNFNPTKKGFICFGFIFFLHAMSLGQEPPGGCPDTLTWNPVEKLCLLECLFPFYSDGEYLTIKILSSVLSVTGFILTYWFCFTAVLRPIMMKHPNTVIFNMFLSCMIWNIGLLFNLFLGDRYVFCNTTNTLATRSNWACITGGMLHHYGFYSFLMWMTVYYITIALRIHLIKIPKIIRILSFFICYFTWSFWIIVIAVILDYWIYYPGHICCAPIQNTNYVYIGIHGMLYLLLIINFICILVITRRLLKIKTKTRTPMRALVIKQIRLIVYLIYYAMFISAFLALIVTRQHYVDSQDEVLAGVSKYIICVFTDGVSECDVNDFITYMPYGVYLTFDILVLFYPIVTFLVFGTRTSLLLFWKEYLQNAWRTKRLPLQFRPSFDSGSITTKIHSLEGGDSISRESRRIIRKLQRRIEEI